MSQIDQVHELTPAEIAAVVEDPMVLELRDDVDELVPTLPVQPFLRVVQALQKEGRLDLVLPHATAEQLTGVLDLSAWREDRVRIPEARGWLLAIVDHIGDDRPRGTLVETIYEMDPEMWGLALAPMTAVAEIDVEDDMSTQRILDHMGALRTWETPDGYFVVGVPDDAFGRAAIKILKAVYADSLEEGRKLANAVKWGLHTEVEEDLLRWRSGRLADLGFPTREDAMRLFVPVGLKEIEPDEDDSVPPPPAVPGALPVSWRDGGDLLRRVMSQLEAGIHGDRSREFLLLVNELMVAQGMEPGDVEGQQRAVHQAQATLSLGLELLVAGEDDEQSVDRLVRVVERAGVRQLFRFAYGPLSKLRKAVLALHREGRISIDKLASLLDRPWGPVLRALSPWYPELPLSNSEEKRRPIRNRSDLARATARVGEAAALARLCFDPNGYAVDPVWVTRVDRPEKLRLGDLIRTALISERLPGRRGGEGFAPLGAEDLGWARRELLDAAGALKPEVESDFRARVAAIGAEVHADVLAEALLTRLATELAGLELDAEDKVHLPSAGGALTVQDVGVWLQMRTGV